VFVVAIAELSGAIDAEAAALAADLGLTAYDARLLLAPGAPVVVKTTADKAQALDLLARLRARGHGAVACDASAVVPSSAMVAMRRFRLEPDAITLDDRPGERLAYDDVLALLAAVHRRRAASSGHVRERQFSATRAVLTSGLSMTKSVKKDTHAVAEERDAVLYVFRRSGSTPWLLHEHGTTWAGHGGSLAGADDRDRDRDRERERVTASENFRHTVSALRQRAGGAAVFDDRLLSRKAIPERTGLAGLATSRGASGSITVHTSSESGVDLLAHVLALWIARRAHR
jgi:hypothetical protein